MLAGRQHGIEPLWSSEIDKQCEAVTSVHFPHVKQLGDIKNIHGGSIAPVDILTGGTPCQNLSRAGDGKGLAGDKSVLFFDFVRIIREMREATHGGYPKYVLWENVPGALNSSEGRDFHVVIKEIIGIKDGKAADRVPGFEKWPASGLIMGDGFSVTWRVVDLQYWGIAQRRRRVYLVADFTGGCAGQILFERTGGERYPDTLTQAGQGDARDDVGSPERNHADRMVYDGRGSGKGDTACAITGGHDNRVTDYTNILIQTYRKSRRAQSNTDYETWVNDGIANTLNVFDSSNSRTTHAIVMAHGQANAEILVGHSPTLSCNHEQPILFMHRGHPRKYLVRRFTPVECERLMGYPDGWTSPRGLRRPMKDTARYRMLGNSIGIPNASWILAKIKENGNESI